MTDDEQYFESEEFQELLGKYEESVSSGQPLYMDADELTDIADYYYEEDKREEAEAAIELAMQLNPNAVEPLEFKARVAMDDGDIKTANEYAERVKEIDKSEYLRLKGEILLNEDDALFSKDMVEWVSDMIGDPAKARETFVNLLICGGDYQESERILKELTDAHPFEKKYWIQLADVQYMKQDYPAAITSSEYAIAIDPEDEDAILTKANSLYQLKNYEEALVYYQRFLDRVPDSQLGYLSLATTLLNLDRTEEAIETLKKGEEQSYDNPLERQQLYQELAYSLCELEQYDEAIAYIDKTKELDCDHTDPELIRGHIYLNKGELDNAEAVFQQILSTIEDKQNVLLRIIITYVDNFYYKEAYKRFKDYFVSYGEECKDGHAFMALCCLKTHHRNDFFKHLAFAIKKNPDETEEVFSPYVPDGMAISEYIQYFENKEDELSI